jgi:hypothetical protein
VVNLVYAVVHGCLEEGEERNGEEIPLIWGDLRMHEAELSYWINAIYNSIEDFLIDNIWCLSISLSKEKNLDTIFGRATGQCSIQLPV